jgi:hypothetical protein
LQIYIDDITLCRNDLSLHLYKFNDKQTIWLTIKINKIDAAYEHTPINSFDYQYSEQINYDFSLEFDLLQ